MSSVLSKEVEEVEEVGVVWAVEVWAVEVWAAVWVVCLRVACLHCEKQMEDRPEDLPVVAPEHPLGKSLHLLLLLVCPSRIRVFFDLLCF